MKICKRCNGQFDISAFSKNKRNTDGFENWCKQCVKEKYSKWRNKNLEYDLKRKRDWRQNNLEYDKQRKAKWSAENLDKRRMSYHKRNIRLKENVFYISDKEIKRLLSSPCFYCGSLNHIQIDHVIPVSKGGRHSIGNIVPACRSCNASKCDKYLVAWKHREKPIDV